MTKRTTNQYDLDLLLMEYATGTLDEAQTMIIASYLDICSEGHDCLRHFEMVGGALMAEHCSPVPMMEDSLNKVLQKLESSLEDNYGEEKPPTPTHQQKNVFPIALDYYLEYTQPQSLPWRKIHPGIEVVTLSFESCTTRGHILRATPGAKAPSHCHEGLELTLILEGGLRDKRKQYRQGDIIIMNEGTVHAPIADEDEGLLCLTITEGPIRPTNLFDMLNNVLKR